MSNLEDAGRSFWGANCTSAKVIEDILIKTDNHDAYYDKQVWIIDFNNACMVLWLFEYTLYHRVEYSK